MYRRSLILVFTALLVVALFGCGVRQLMPSKKTPPLEGYSTIVLLPFDFDKTPEKAEYVNLPTLVSYAAGTKMKVRHEDKVWLYDQSQEVRPVSKKLEELGVSAGDIFEDPLTAVDTAKAFGADLIIIGRLDEPRFTKEESGKIHEDKSETTPTGAARYYMIYQTATLAANLRVVDVKQNLKIWDGLIIGYKKYETLYRTGSPPKSEREESMLADVRRDLVQKIVDKLYPAK